MAAMKYRPLIGINTDYRATAKGRTPHCYMHSGYFDCLLSANAFPVFIPPLDPGNRSSRRFSISWTA